MSPVRRIRTQLRTFLGWEDIVAGPQNFKGLFEGLDLDLMLDLELGLG